MDEIVNKFSPLELAKIIGEPLDPRKPYTDVVDSVAFTDTADPNEYVYYHVATSVTNLVYTVTATGAITSSNVSPESPTAFTFIDNVTPEYYVKINELASAKEATLSRVLKLINQTLNMKENKYIMDLGIASANDSQTLTSGQMRFSYNDLIEMMLGIVDYSDNYVLFVGSEIDQDMLLWDWNDNKYHSTLEAFNSLGIKKIRMGVGNLTVDTNAPARQLASNRALLVGTSTELGKPFVFVRKKLNDIDLLGAAIKQDGEKPQRLVFVSSNPVTPSGGTSRYMAIGVFGYEQIVAALVNPYAVSKFLRS
jgi:hypothetical protein